MAEIVTDEENLAKIVQAVRWSIDRLVNEADKYSQKMSEDYEHFFRWNAADMYKIQLMLSEYRKIQRVICGGSFEKALECLHGNVREFERILLERQVIPSNTNAMFNLAEAYNLEAFQTLREEYKSILHSIGY